MTIVIPHKNSKVILESNEILYIYRFEGSVRIVTTRINSNTNQNLFYIDSTKTIKDYTQSLRNDGFFQIHKSNLVNRIFIEKVELSKQNGHLAIMSDQESLEISRRNYPLFKKWLEDNQKASNLAEVKTPHFITLDHTPDKNTLFIGRREVLTEIEKIIVSTEKPIVICGQRGSGKTVLVEKYYSKHKTQFDNIGWLNYEGDFIRTIINQIPTEATLEIIENHSNSNQLLRAARMVVNQQILNLSGKTLIVIDGIAGSSDLEEYSEFLNLANSRIIITSGQPIENYTNFHLPPITYQNTKDLFSSLANFHDTPFLKELISQLDNHPLSIKLLALNTPNINWEAAGDFHRKILNELKEIDGTEPNALGFVQALFQLAELSLNEEWLLLQFAALPSIGFELKVFIELITNTEIILSPNGFDLPDLEDIQGYQNYISEFGEDVPEKPETIDQAIASLVSKGWLEKKDAEYFLPDLIKQVTILELDPFSGFYVELIESLENNYLSDDYGPIKVDTLLISFLNQIISILEYGEPYRRLHTILITIYEGLFEFSLELEEHIKYIKRLESFESNENERGHEAYGNLANCYRRKGKLSDALLYKKEQLKIAKKIFHSNHPDLATSYADTAIVYNKIGNIHKALKLHQKALEIRQICLEFDHPGLAHSYSSISSVLGNLGKYKQALEFQKKALAIRELIFDPEEEELAESYNNISVCYLNIGENEKALSFVLKAIKIYEKNIDRFSLITSYRNLSVIYNCLGKNEEALVSIKKTYNLMMAMPDQADFDLAHVFEQFACVYEKLEKYEEGLKFIKRAIPIFEKTLGIESSIVAHLYHTKAKIYGLLGEYEKGLKLHQKALKIRQTILEPNHPDLAGSYYHFGTFYQEFKKNKQALIFHQKALKIREAVLEAYHPDLINTYNSIAVIYEATHEFEKAKTFWEKVNIASKQNLQET